MGKRKYTIESVKNFVINNSECLLESNAYVRYKDPLTFKCSCNNIFITSFQEFKCGKKRQCNECGFKKCNSSNRLTIEEVKNQVYNNSDAELLSEEYINNSQKLSFKCRCGNKFKRSYANFIKGSNICVECSKEKMRNKFQFTYNEVKNQIELNGCTLLSTSYKNTKSKLLIMCKCGNKFKRTLTDFKVSRHQCSECSDSKPATAIKEYLSKNNVCYNKEQDYEGLIGLNGGNLRYDYALLDNGLTRVIIEYDGEFHFHQFYKEQKFDLIKTHDNIKNNFCKNKNIPLIRIPYWEQENLETILDNVLGYFKLSNTFKTVDKKLVHKYLVNHPEWSNDKYIEQQKQIS